MFSNETDENYKKKVSGNSAKTYCKRKDVYWRKSIEIP
jgi:hypothetical protein